MKNKKFENFENLTKPHHKKINEQLPATAQAENRRGLNVVERRLFGEISILGSH